MESAAAGAASTSDAHSASSAGAVLSMGRTLREPRPRRRDGQHDQPPRAGGELSAPPLPLWEALPVCKGGTARLRRRPYRGTRRSAGARSLLFASWRSVEGSLAASVESF